MTAAAPRFTVPRTDRRECALYRVYVLHPKSGKVVLGYIGETARTPWTRFQEHLYDQPWGDTIVGHPHVDPRAFNSKAEVLAAEKAAVLAEKPLYNIEYQTGAPHAIPQWEARRQRDERDRRRGVPLTDWAAKGERPSAPRPVQSRPASSTLSPKWQRRRNIAFGWVAAELTSGLLALAVFWWADGKGLAVDWTVRWWVSALVLPVAVLAWWQRRRIRRWLRRLSR